MHKEHTATAIQENEVEKNEAAILNGGEVIVNGVRFYCRFIDGGSRLACVSIDLEEKVQLLPPENGYFYSVAIKQLANGSED